MQPVWQLNADGVADTMGNAQSGSGPHFYRQECCLASWLFQGSEEPSLMTQTAIALLNPARMQMHVFPSLAVRHALHHLHGPCAWLGG